MNFSGLNLNNLSTFSSAEIKEFQHLLDSELKKRTEKKLKEKVNALYALIQELEDFLKSNDIEDFTLSFDGCDGPSEPLEIEYSLIYKGWRLI